MSEEQLKAFLDKVKDDPNLQEKLKTAADAHAVVSIAKEAGYLLLKTTVTSLELST